jgi:hypothetical protein
VSGHDFSRADRLFIFLFEPALAGGRRLPNNFFSASSARRFHRSDRSKALFEQGTGQVAKYEERPSRRRPIWPRM